MVTGTVLPQVAKSHTVPITMQPVLRTPRVYPHPCYSLAPKLTGDEEVSRMNWQGDGSEGRAIVI